nr:MAG TPA: Protein of unknown function (DUF1366) [Caudoviricetes sp.]
MMTGYEVKSKFLKQDMTEVVVCKELPYTYVQRQLPGNLLDKSDEYLIQRVMDLVNMEYDPSSAIAQLSALSNEVKERLTKVDDLAVKTEKTSETTQKSLLELTEQVFNLTADLEALKASHYEEVEHPTTTDTAPTTAPQPVTEQPVTETPAPTTTTTEQPVATPTTTTEVEHHDETPSTSTPNIDNQTESTEHPSTPADGTIASI